MKAEMESWLPRARDVGGKGWRHLGPHKGELCAAGVAGAPGRGAGCVEET